MFSSNIDSTDKYGTKAISINDFIMTQYIKTATAKNSSGDDILYNLEFLDDGSIEIELKNVDISNTGWVNVTLEFNQWFERNSDSLENQSISLAGINSKTGTFHLSVTCPEYGYIGLPIQCSIEAQVEASQTLEKEVDFTCYIKDGLGNNISSLNWNQMVTKDKILMNKHFLVPLSLRDASEYILQCEAVYYNIGGRMDSFYNTFMTTDDYNNVVIEDGVVVGPDDPNTLFKEIHEIDLLSA